MFEFFNRYKNRHIEIDLKACERGKMRQLRSELNSADILTKRVTGKNSGSYEES